VSRSFHRGGRGVEALEMLGLWARWAVGGCCCCGGGVVVFTMIFCFVQ